MGRVGHTLVCCSNNAHTARFLVHHWGPARHDFQTESECRLPITSLFVVGSEQGPRLTNRSHFSDPALLLLGDTSCFRIHPLMLVAIPALPLLCSDKRQPSEISYKEKGMLFTMTSWISRKKSSLFCCQDINLISFSFKLQIRSPNRSRSDSILHKVEQDYVGDNTKAMEDPCKQSGPLVLII